MRFLALLGFLATGLRSVAAVVAPKVGGKGNYVTTAMEDIGIYQSLAWLSRAGKADVRRLLVLRTASNFDMQWPGATAAGSMFGEKITHYSGYYVLHRWNRHFK